MIVIATNNGHRFLPELIRRLEQYGTGGHEVLLVDTGSRDPQAAEYLSSLSSYSGPFALRCTQTPYGGYDTGAYLWAYRNHFAGRYLFLQDSVLPKVPQWVEQFEARLSHRVGAVPWMTFPLQWDDAAQRDFIFSRFGEAWIPPHGIFGPMFLAERWALDRLDSMGLLQTIPKSKPEQQAMERGWAAAFCRADVAIRPVNVAYSGHHVMLNRCALLDKQIVRRA